MLVALGDNMLILRLTFFLFIFSFIQIANAADDYSGGGGSFGGGGAGGDWGDSTGTSSSSMCKFSLQPDYVFYGKSYPSVDAACQVAFSESFLSSHGRYAPARANSRYGTFEGTYYRTITYPKSDSKDFICSIVVRYLDENPNIFYDRMVSFSGRRIYKGTATICDNETHPSLPNPTGGGGSPSDGISGGGGGGSPSDGISGSSGGGGGGTHNYQYTTNNNTTVNNTYNTNLETINTVINNLDNTVNNLYNAIVNNSNTLNSIDNSIKDNSNNINLNLDKLAELNVKLGDLSLKLADIKLKLGDIDIKLGGDNKDYDFSGLEKKLDSILKAIQDLDIKDGDLKPVEIPDADYSEIIKKIDDVKKQVDETGQKIDKRLERINENLERMQKCNETQFNQKVCDFIDWVQQPFQSKDDGKLDVKDGNLTNINQNRVKFKDQCPPPKPINITVMGQNFGTAMDYQPLCDFFSMLKPFVVGMGWVAGAFIIVGRRGGY